MSAEFVLRIVGMVVLATAGLYLGVYLADLIESPPYQYAVLFLLLGALAGLILTPLFTIKPFMALRRSIRQLPPQQLIAGIIGLTIGLVMAALLSLPLSLLPSPLRQILPFIAVVVFSYTGMMVFTMRQQDIFSVFRGRGGNASDEASGGAAERGISASILLDTSVIIDGRIADISRTGFIDDELLVPRFVLNELQHIADSSDVLRRNRGRRGLDMLRRLQDESMIPVRITDMDVEDVREVDDKLVLLAKQLHCRILTNDYNLNRVAELQGVTVLNINELANAIKTVLLPGEDFEVQIIQEGKEIDQGVGYLDDGTMVVVEDGKHHIGRTISVTVTKVLQTAAGRMIFARP